MRRRFVRTGTGVFVICLLLAGLVAAALGDDLTAPRKVRRWESNLSIGHVSNGRLGVVKSLWWFGVPNVLALGLSFDCIFQEAIPLSIDVALNAPLPVVRPFVCAGAGTALNGRGITHYGGGLKVRLGRDSVSSPNTATTITACSCTNFPASGVRPTPTISAPGSPGSTDLSAGRRVLA